MALHVRGSKKKERKFWITNHKTIIILLSDGTSNDINH